MITVLSRDEMRKGVVTESRDGFTVTYYRKAQNWNRTEWVYDHCATIGDAPLHLVLDTAHAVVDAPTWNSKFRG